jgi:hypothetical protein
MTRFLTLAALLLTAACGQLEQPAPANDVAATPATTVAPTAKAAVPSLKGVWHVAGAKGLTATFSSSRVVLAEGCVRRAWNYTQKGNAVAFTAAPDGSSNCGGSASAAMDNAFGPLSDANIAVFGADGSDVTLSGLGGTLQLQRR